MTQPPPPPPGVPPSLTALRLRAVSAHLTTAQMIWLSAGTASTHWNSAWHIWRLWSPPPAPPAGAPQPAELRGEAEPGGAAAALSPAAAAALRALVARRLAQAVEGASRYLAHPPVPATDPGPVLWSCGAARLHRLGPAGGRPVVLVPSLINRARLLHLAPGASLVQALADAGLQPLLLDWGPAHPGEGLDRLVPRVVVPALRVARSLGAGPPALLGYCMGGLLALAALALDPDLQPGLRLVLMATPWDFHADGSEGRLARLLAPSLSPVMAVSRAGGVVAPEALWPIFYRLDPMIGPNKLLMLAREQDPQRLARMVALEDWTNDGVALSTTVAATCFQDWYGDNVTRSGRWQVAGVTVDPATIRVPTLAVIPAQDRVVPAASARALGQSLPDATLLEVPFGHTGMIASRRAPLQLWPQIIGFLRDGRPRAGPGDA